MEKLGLDVLDSLARAVGFENPFRSGSNRVCPLMWISEDVPGNKPDLSGRVYPYIIGLQYQITSQKHSLLVDSGWITVSPRVDSVMVTVGDIAQVRSVVFSKSLCCFCFLKVKIELGPVVC